MMYDVVIIGGGPGGVAAGVYVARKKLKTVLITESFGGQSLVSDSIENWIGTKAISGLELAQALEAHLRAQEEIEIVISERVVRVDEITGGFEIQTDKEHRYQSKTIILTSGGRRRRLKIPGEDKFEGKGVVFCSTCDAPLFRNKTVAVVGGGNAGLEAVVDLFPYATKIYLIVRSDRIKGDPGTFEEVQKSPKVTILYNALSQEILGEKLVTGLRYLDSASNENKEIVVNGVFVEIGSIPNSEMMKGVVVMNEMNEVVIDHKTCTTSKQGIFAAGDVTDEIYKQNNISVGDAVKAALSAYGYILKLNKQLATSTKRINERSVS